MNVENTFLFSLIQSAGESVVKWVEPTSATESTGATFWLMRE